MTTSTAVERHEGEAQVATLDAQAQVLGVSEQRAQRVWQIAKVLANTKIVPGPLQGNPEAIVGVGLHLAALGLEVSLPTLKLVHVWTQDIKDRQGRVTGEQTLMMEHYQLRLAQIHRAGHEAWLIEATDQRAAFGLRRRGSQREEVFEYTIAEAEKAGLTTKPGRVWQQHTSTMLCARAVGKMFKLGCPDVIFGPAPIEEPAPVPRVVLGELGAAEPEPAPLSDEDRDALKAQIAQLNESRQSYLRAWWGDESLPPIDHADFGAGHARQVRERVLALLLEQPTEAEVAEMLGTSEEPAEPEVDSGRPFDDGETEVAS